MISYEKVQIALVKHFKSYFKGIEVETTDIEEEFKRPCLYIDLRNTKNSNLMDKMCERSLEYEVFYFPSHPKNNQREILEKLDLFNKTLVENDYLELEKGFITQFEEVEIFTLDKVIHAEFKINLAEEYIKEHCMMEEIIEEGFNGNK